MHCIVALSLPMMKNLEKGEGGRPRFFGLIMAASLSFSSSSSMTGSA
jgi:hypothetical protein